ncbi:hypothetical protein AJ88_04270 [Mesorhizobium amorphae CCBAU 01583]|nr:hypothetical protein AJ88_04270 [Mesorhizobium amorphae CCBAU 01583]
MTRNADVRDILERGDEFETPYGPEMAELARGSNFILGMQDGAAYRQMKSSVLSAFPPAEVEAMVRPIAAHHSKDIMARASPGFDAISGLMKIVPVRICRDYFGLEIDDESEFADWAIALSALFFSDPTASPTTRQLAVVAGDRLIKVIDRSIDAIRVRGGKDERPLPRLVALLDQGRLSKPDLHSVMLGMIAGFVPTNVLAGSNCLDVILSRPDARRAVDAALADDDTGKLDRAIMEAMRFKPIWVGPWRYTSRDATIARGTPRERLVKAGTVVMPATLSAMFDPDAVQNPNDFDTTRPLRDYMVFGHGIHLCIGAEIARIQIGESIAPCSKRTGCAGARQGRADDESRRLSGKPQGRFRPAGAVPHDRPFDGDGGLPDHTGRIAGCRSRKGRDIRQSGHAGSRRGTRHCRHHSFHQPGRCRHWRDR